MTIYEMMEWVTRMQDRFGARVYDYTQPAKIYDWGQALARERYGPDFTRTAPPAPTAEDMDRARRWEEGEWPEWAWTTKTATPHGGQAS